MSDMEALLELKILLSNHPMFAVGLLLMAGYGIGKLVARLGLPEITGYILAGILVSHSVSGIFPAGLHEAFSIVTEIAVSLIALTIGAEFSVQKMRRIGRDVLTITLVQISLVFFTVSGVLWLLGMGWPFALLLGVIATATEPAATVAEVHALRARGRFVDYLFSIVALDDASCVVLFSMLLSFVTPFLEGAGVAAPGATLPFHVIWALKDILASLLLGLCAGYALHRLTRLKTGANEILILALGVLLISTALAIVFHLSPLLANLAAGSLLINASPRNHRILRALEPLTPPIYALFFVIAGTELDFRVMLQPGLISLGAGYILVRALSKYAGIYLGCRVSGVTEPLRRNLGWCMLPQGGVAMGLILLVQSSPVIASLAAPSVEAMLAQMLNIVLMCVFVSELMSPPLSRMGILRGCAQTAGHHDGDGGSRKARVP